MKLVLVFALATLYFVCSSEIDKISPQVFEEIKLNNGHSSILVHFSEKVDFDSLHLDLMDHSTKGWVIMYALQEVAQRTQANVKSLLDTHRMKYTPFWATNVIVVEKASLELIREIAKRPEVEKITADFPFKTDLNIESMNAAPSAPHAGEEWNVRWINAHKLFEKGFKGKGFVVAGADTGYDYTHEAIKKQYRGGENGPHDYHWWDAVKEPFFGRNSTCGFNSPKPCDDGYHGTHTMGTMCGEAPNRKIGVAPEAKWIGCRQMEGGYSRALTIISCLQFFLAPTNLAGKNPNPDKRPHATGHSYGCASSRCPDTEAAKAAVEALRRAGVFVVVAAGNSGPTCSTIGRGGPPGHYAASFTIGATGYNTDNIASFSSRGPVTIDRSNRRKPDVTAPGQSVTSCVPGGQYRSLSGTSMATPAVTGAIALLYSAVPSLARNVQKTQELLQKTAHNQKSTDCQSTQQSPNNVYGYGTIDLEKAYKTALREYIN